MSSSDLKSVTMPDSDVPAHHRPTRVPEKVDLERALRRAIPNDLRIPKTLLLLANQNITGTQIEIKWNDTIAAEASQESRPLDKDRREFRAKARYGLQLSEERFVCFYRDKAEGSRAFRALVADPFYDPNPFVRREKGPRRMQK